MDPFELVPDTDIRTWVGPFQDRRLYFDVGKKEAERYIDLAGIKPHHRVLDLGCGCGKVAIHLAPYLQGGQYTGVDNNASLLDWCWDRIAPVFGHCSFHFIDVYNGAYHPEGKVPASAMRLELPSESVDVVIANSLFTHLRIEDVAAYLQEIHRVLRPGGTIAATYLLLNDQSITAMARNEAAFNLCHAVGDCSRTKDEAIPEEGIGHGESVIRRLYAECGYEITAVHHGNWVGIEAKDFQDMVIAIR